MGHDSLPDICSVKCLHTKIKTLPFCKTEGIPEHWEVLTGEDRCLGPSGNEVWSDITEECYRSDLERKLCEWLYFLNEPYEFEPVTFVIPPQNGHGVCHYTPDVLLTRRRTFLEAKGVWGSGQRGRITALLKLHPDFKLILVPYRFKSALQRACYV